MFLEMWFKYNINGESAERQTWSLKFDINKNFSEEVKLKNKTGPASIPSKRLCPNCKLNKCLVEEKQPDFWCICLHHPSHACLCACKCFSPSLVIKPSKRRLNLLGEISMHTGQYQLLPQSQMEAGWGDGVRQAKAAQSPNIIMGLREAIKPSLGRLPLLQPEHKPIAFCFVLVIFLSALVRQHDRWFSLVRSSWFSPPGEPSDTFICRCLLPVCATTERPTRERILLAWPGALISVLTCQRGSELPQNQDVTDEGIA